MNGYARGEAFRTHPSSLIPSSNVSQRLEISVVLLIHFGVFDLRDPWSVARDSRLRLGDERFACHLVGGGKSEEGGERRGEVKLRMWRGDGKCRGNHVRSDQKNVVAPGAGLDDQGRDGIERTDRAGALPPAIGRQPVEDHLQRRKT